MLTRAVVVSLLALILVPWVAQGQPGNPHDPRNFSWVREGVLAVGGGGLTPEDVRTVRELGFGAVSNFRAEHNDPEDVLAQYDIAYQYIPTEYALDLNITMLESFIAFTKAQEADGRVVYAHCISGWHRTAAAAVAWLMEREGLSYDEASRSVMQNREQTAMRVPGILLAYEAKLNHQPGLVVMMNAAKAHPLPGGELPITIDVFANGQLHPGAAIKVWGENEGTLAEGTTDASGRFTFTFRAADDARLTYLYARASSPGFVDGADNIEMYHFLPVPGNDPIEIKHAVVGNGISISILDAGTPVSARILAATPGGWSAYDTTMTGITTLPRPAEGGEVTVIASRFGEAPVTATFMVAATASAPEPTPASAPDPAVENTFSPSLLVMVGVAGLIALVAISAFFIPRRGRPSSR